MIFCIRLSVPIQTETDILLYKCCHCLVKGSHDPGLLIQYFCSMDGRIQWLEPMKVFAGFWNTSSLWTELGSPSTPLSQTIRYTISFSFCWGGSINGFLIQREFSVTGDCNSNYPLDVENQNAVISSFLYIEERFLMVFAVDFEVSCALFQKTGSACWTALSLCSVNIY